MIIGPTKTLGVKPLSRTANRKRIRRSIETPDLPLDLSDARVIIDWSDTYGITPSATDETVIRITGYRDYLNRIKVYNLSNIEVE